MEPLETDSPDRTSSATDRHIERLRPLQRRLWEVGLEVDRLEVELRRVLGELGRQRLEETG